MIFFHVLAVKLNLNQNWFLQIVPIIQNMKFLNNSPNIINLCDNVDIFLAVSLKVLKVVIKVWGVDEQESVKLVSLLVYNCIVCSWEAKPALTPCSQSSTTYHHTFLFNVTMSASTDAFLIHYYYYIISSHYLSIF